MGERRMDKKVTSVSKDAHLQEEIYFKKRDTELLKALRSRLKAETQTSAKIKKP